jgi:hypothetical protein
MQDGALQECFVFALMVSIACAMVRCRFGGIELKHFWLGVGDDE